MLPVSLYCPFLIAPSGILQHLFQFMLVEKVIVYTCLCVQYKLGVITLTLARGVQHIVCCVCVLFFHRRVCPMLPISLDYPLLIAPFGII
jgi:hypothetical protein